MAKKTKPLPPVTVPAPEGEKPQELELMFCGFVRTTDKKTGARWMPRALFSVHHSAEEIKRNCSIFAVDPKHKPRSIGGIYEARGFLDESGKLDRMVTSSVRWTDTGPHHEAWVRFKAEHEAELMEARHEAAHKKVGSRDEIADRMKPLRDAWLMSDRNGRLAIEVLVLQALRHG